LGQRLEGQVGLRDFTLSDFIDRNAQPHGARLAFVAVNWRLSSEEIAQGLPDGPRIEQEFAGA
jgi:hypothetical protein